MLARSKGVVTHIISVEPDVMAGGACLFLLPPQQGSQAAHISSGLRWVLLLLECHVQNVEGF